MLIINGEKMKYIYPKFTNKELPFVRFGGAGLGNLLFTYARALILANETGAKLVNPTWPCLKIGPVLRREKDKRFYFDLFKNGNGSIDGLKKTCLLLFSEKTKVNSISDVKSARDGSLLIYDEFKMNFDGLIPYRNLILSDIIGNLKKKNRKPLEEDFTNAINVHVRCGDFLAPNSENLKNGVNNTRIPISWYVGIIKQIQNSVNKDIKFNIFSDGTDEELKDILALPNTKRVFYGTSIADIIALSRSKLIIASGSSFSMWARFLGNCNSISYLNQRKDFVGDKTVFEIETDSLIAKKELEKIYMLF